MKSFRELGIEAPAQAFSGDKIKMSKVLNKLIVVHKFRIVQSKFEKGSGQRLDMQIEINNTQYIVWCGSVTLMETIKKIPADSFPFETTIVMENERYEFT